jgi:hypothetical protein
VPTLPTLRSPRLFGLGASLALAATLACGGTPAPTVPALELVTAALPEAALERGFDAKLAAQGGVPPYAFDLVEGALPAGLNLDAVTGQLRGVPTAPGRARFVARVKDTVGGAASRALELRVAPHPLLPGENVLPEAVEGASYSATLEASGGVPPLRFGLASGSLPEGLILTEAGDLSGTPGASGAYPFEVEIADGEGTLARQSLRLTVRAAIPMITVRALTPVQLGERFETGLEAQGGRAPYSWSVSMGDLPEGVALLEDGRLGGEPTAAGQFTFTVRVTDAAGRTDDAELSLLVIAPLVIETRALPSMQLGRAVEIRLSAAGGLPPYRWFLGNNSQLPPGLTFAEEGLLSGVPTADGTFPLTVRVQDAQGILRSAMFTARVRDQRVYEASPALAFPPLCGTSTHVSYQGASVDVPDSFQVAGLTVEVDVAFADASSQDSNDKLKLVLWAPDGRHAALCGHASSLRAERGCSGAGGVRGSFGDTQNQPDTAFRTFTGMNPQGTWRFFAVVTRPTIDAGGVCAQRGTINAVRLIFDPDRSAEPYVIVGGIRRNNLVSDPWVRIQGGGLQQQDAFLSATLWEVGPNGLREGGRGDDRPTEATFTWTASNLPPGTTVSPDGHVQSGSQTNRGARGATTVTASDGAGNSVTLPLMVLPPDWLPRVREF